MSCTQLKPYILTKTLLFFKRHASCFLLFILVLVLLPSCNTVRQSKPFWSVEDCVDNLRYNSNYWKRDSLGQNGFRQLYATTVLNKCNFEGQRWRDISSLLGKANSIYNNSGRTTHLYRLEYDEKELYVPGMFVLDAQVKNDTIIMLKVRLFHD